MLQREIIAVCSEIHAKHVHKLFVGLIRRTACARAQFSACSSTTNAYSEMGQMALWCQNLPLGSLSSRSAPSMLVGELLKKFGLFFNTGVCQTSYSIFPHTTKRQMHTFFLRYITLSTATCFGPKGTTFRDSKLSNKL